MIHHSIFRRGKKVLTAIVGGLVTLLGIILIPYPGPGWLVVFAGLAILATEFQFAARLLAVLKNTYEAWLAWLQRQPRIIRALVLAFTGLFVLVTVWLLNTFGLIDTLLRLNQPWLHSPVISK